LTGIFLGKRLGFGIRLRARLVTAWSEKVRCQCIADPRLPLERQERFIDEVGLLMKDLENSVLLPLSQVGVWVRVRVRVRACACAATNHTAQDTTQSS
jgi:hypothetical protein